MNGAGQRMAVNPEQPEVPGSSVVFKVLGIHICLR